MLTENVGHEAREAEYERYEVREAREHVGYEDRWAPEHIGDEAHEARGYEARRA